MEDPIPQVSFQAATNFLSLCPLCEKAYTSEHSFNRHVSYCRRAQSKRKGRPKSCLACSSSKTKCSFGKPQCSRCELKGLECVYDQRKQLPRKELAELSLHEPAYTPGLTYHGSIETDDLPDFDFAALNDIDVTYANSPERVQQGNKHHQDTHLLLSTTYDEPESINLFDSSVTDSPDDLVAISKVTGTLTHLRHGNPATKHAASLVTQIMLAFPQMMLRRTTFPPFIHSYWHLPALPDILASCMSIAQLFATRTPETRPFLWRMIDAEERRFLNELYEMPVEDIQHAVQAMIIFIIMAIIDQNADNTHRGGTLIQSFQVLCTRFRYLLDAEFFSETEAVEPSASWEQWVFAESRRRITSMWFVMSRVVSAEADAPCTRFYGYACLPLVSGKGLWEARSREEWETEKAFHDASFPMTVFGELVDARRRPDSPHDGRLTAWEANVDKMGLIMNIATALV